MDVVAAIWGYITLQGAGPGLESRVLSRPELCIRRCSLSHLVGRIGQWDPIPGQLEQGGRESSGIWIC